MEKTYNALLGTQSSPENIRNVCVIAHVDHGKTTLCDSLISSNKIISDRLIGKLRYMDSREDEQERCITMKSSSISLIYPLNDKLYQINLIDSPGHIEFLTEVSIGLRMCDGAIVLIDVIEGVSSQTLRVVKQALSEKLKCILFLNKIDKLYYDLELTPMEAYKHISVLLDCINAAVNDIMKLEIIDFKGNEEKENDVAYALDEELLAQMESKLLFSPEKGNVLFGSAIDCWAFSLNDFAETFAKKYGWKQSMLEKILWGEYYLNMRTKKVHTKPLTESSKPFFVQFILENFWKIYEYGSKADKENFTKVANVIGCQLNEKSLDTLHIEPKPVIAKVMKHWKPLDQCVLKKIITTLPSPCEGQKESLPAICKKLYTASQDKHSELLPLKHSVEKCSNNPNDPVIVFISKMIYTKKEHINERGLCPSSGEPLQLVAFGRIFSGKLTRGSTVYVKTPKAKAITQDTKFSMDNKIECETTIVKIDKIYIFMGQYLEGMAEVSAGNICGIIGLENIVHKTGILSTDKNCPLFASLDKGAYAILKVAISSKHLCDMPKLVDGLKKLGKCDPAIEIYTEENSDIILGTSGEVHLQRCIKDLQDDFAKVEVTVSDPLVFFKETIIKDDLDLHEKINKTLLYENKSLEKAEDVEEEKIETKPEEFEGDTNDNRFQFKPADHYYKTTKDTKPVSKNLLRNKEIKIDKINTLNIKKLRNYITLCIPSKKLSIRVRGIGMKAEVREWLESKQTIMKKLFNFSSEQGKEEDYINFFDEFFTVLENSGTAKFLITLIRNHLVQFGPRFAGSNMLLNTCISAKNNLFNRCKLRFEKKNVTQNNVIDGSQSNQEITAEKSHNKIDAPEEAKSAEFENKNPAETNLAMQITSGEYKLNEIKTNQTNVLEENKISNNSLDLSKTNANEVETKINPNLENVQLHLNTIQHNKLDLSPNISNDYKKSGIENSNLKNIEQSYKTFKEKFRPFLSQSKLTLKEVNKAFATGFELAIEAGPLCNEPIVGVIYIIEDISVLEGAQASTEEEHKNEETTNAYGPLTGQIMGTMKEACKEAFLGAEPRLVQALFKCMITVSSENYGAVYDVLRRRKANFIREDVQEFTNYFVIESHLPVCESFGFYNEIFTATSGMVTPQMEFHTWKILDVDPFYVPQTQKDLEEFGEQFVGPNYAKLWIDKTRERKGIATDKKIVQAAEKQSTLSKKKQYVLYKLQLILQQFI